MKSGGKVLIQVLVVSLIGLASVVGGWLLSSQGASASPMLQGALHHIVICTDASGQTSAGDHTMTTDDTWTLYAAGYDAGDIFLGNQTVTWGKTDDLDDVSGSSTSYPFSPSTADTSGTITASASVTMTDATGTITVNAGALHHIVICTDANGQTPANDHTMTTDDTWLLYAAGLDADDNFIANQTATWGQTGDLDNVSGNGTSYTFSPSTADTSGRITAAHTTATDGETGIITVGVGDLDHIVICTDANGQTPANGHTMTTDDTWTLYAAGYDAEYNFIANQTATWDQTGDLDDVSGSSTSYTFSPSTADTSGTITAEANGKTDATGTITVDIGALDHIVICTDANGQAPAGDHTMTTDDTWTLYAAGYDADDNFIANQTATWDETGTLDNVSAGSGTSYTFEPETAPTSGRITADADGMDDETGTITVDPGALDYIEICTDDEGQHPAGSCTMTTDNTWTLYAAGYDAEDNFRGNETATWGKTGTLDEVSHSGPNYTFSPSTAPTSGRITANASGKTDETGMTTVNVGALNYIKIEDAAGGTGNEVNAHSLVVGETFQVWAAGYDADDNYRSDVAVTWTGTDVVAGRLSPASGSSTTTFTAEEAGTGTIEANDGSGHEDETGLITVQTPVLAITKSDNPDPVNPGATLAYTIIITNSGDANGTAVIVTEHYDPNFLFQGASPLPDGYPTSNRTWTIDTLEVGASQTIIVWGNVASPLPVGTVLTNQVTLDSDQTTPVTVTEVTDVTTASELMVSKVDIPDPVPAGGDLTYIISYQNGGTAPADDVVITEEYDSQVTFVSASPVPRGGTDNVWDIGDLAVGGNGSIQVTVRVDTPLPDGSTLTNRVTIDSAHTSPQTCVEITGVSSPDLVIAAAHEPSIFSPGELMTYTVTYSNTGHWQAEGVIITTTLPPDTTYVGQGWISSDGQTYIYVVGYLSSASDASEQAYFVVCYPDRPQIGAVEFNTPFVISESGSSGDANLGNNTTYVYIGVPDLVITDFTVEPWPLRPDVPVTFVIVLENQGAGPAWNPGNKGGFWVDVFMKPVVSYPWIEYSKIFTSVPPLGPGAMCTVTIPYTQGFTLQQIQDDVHGFYPKVDNYHEHLYGLVPEYNEMNNTRMHRVYLPLVFR